MPGRTDRACPYIDYLSLLDMLLLGLVGTGLHHTGAFATLSLGSQRIVAVVTCYTSPHVGIVLIYSVISFRTFTCVIEPYT